MSIQFNDTTNYRGLVQKFEREVGFKRGDVSNNEDRLKEFTVDVNEALDDFFAIALPAAGTWQLDDSNHTDDYTIATTDLFSGQRSYEFITDENGNLALDIYRVFIKSENDSVGYSEIFPVDQQSDILTSGFWDGRNVTGTPGEYDKTGNSIILDPIPGYSAEDGLKVMFNREGSYFSYTDTIKKPGVIGLFHKYFYLKPALEFARREQLAVYSQLVGRVAEVEDQIKKHYGSRARDERNRITMKRIKHR